MSRGRSQSDPSVLTDSSATSSADAGENPGNGLGGGRRAGSGRPEAGGPGSRTPRGSAPRLQQEPALGPRFLSPVSQGWDARSPLSIKELISWVEPGAAASPPFHLVSSAGPSKGASLPRVLTGWGKIGRTVAASAQRRFWALPSLPTAGPQLRTFPLGHPLLEGSTPQLRPPR